MWCWLEMHKGEHPECDVSRAVRLISAARKAAGLAWFPRHAFAGRWGFGKSWRPKTVVAKPGPAGSYYH